MPPSIVAFTVTPTSGEAPYTFSADISGVKGVDGVHYRASVLASTAVGSCPTSGEAPSFSASQIEMLLSTGTAYTSTSVALGSCRTFTLRIHRVSDSTLIAISSVNVDNV